MKALRLIFCFSLVIFAFSLSYGQSWDWGRQGTVNIKPIDPGVGIVTNKTGDAYLTGLYYSSIAFDTIFEYRDSSFLDNGTLYLVKYNNAGKALWVYSALGTAQGLSDAVDQHGMILVTGWYEEELYIGSTTLRSGDVEMFLAKFDENGNVIWAVGSTNGYQCQANSVATDRLGNSFVVGYFADTVTFGSTKYDTKSNNIQINNSFIAKYDTGGNLLWTDQGIGYSTAGIPYNNQCFSVSTDYLGNAIATGYFGCITKLTMLLFL